MCECGDPLVRIDAATYGELEQLVWGVSRGDVVEHFARCVGVERGVRSSEQLFYAAVMRVRWLRQPAWRKCVLWLAGHRRGVLSYGTRFSV